MRHSLYANNSRVTPGRKKVPLKRHNSKTHTNNTQTLDDRILNLRVSTLMDRYKNDPEIIEDMKNTISSYLLNISIARDLRSRGQEKKLTKAFTTYLSKLEKEN